MIPHHGAAIEMCGILLHNLTCSEISDIDDLDGLVPFCSHLAMEENGQVGEVSGMRRWLETKGIEEKAPCPDSVSRQGSVMMESCGLVAYPSAVGLIEANQKMHSGMAIDVSCDHSVDFVRGMLPHHEGAIAMCDVLMETTSDVYLVELCGNVTVSQYAEIAWMREWLENRNLNWYAPCSDCDNDMMDAGMAGEDLPCEDLLSTSSFCHSLGEDSYCTCDDVLENVSRCGASIIFPGVGLMNVDEECARSCGLCPERKPLFHYLCGDGHSMHGDMDGMGDMDDMGDMEGDQPDHGDMDGMGDMDDMGDMEGDQPDHGDMDGMGDMGTTDGDEPDHGDMDGMDDMGSTDDSSAAVRSTVLGLLTALFLLACC
jgi:uncharacterized protein (DUF305 family)